MQSLYIGRTLPTSSYNLLEQEAFNMSEKQDYTYRFCPQCGHALALIELKEDSGPVARLRCPHCQWTHWDNPTPVLAGIVEIDGQILLARNALWTDGFFGLITGFMEAGETPEDGIAREVKEETNLDVYETSLVDVSAFLRKNQVLLAYHVKARGTVALSPELADYKLENPATLQCWTTGTGFALRKWLRSQGHEPVMFERIPKS